MTLNLAALALFMEASVAAFAAQGGRPGDAEYAIRWNPTDSGPKSAAKTLALLQLKDAEIDKFQVEYFDVATPSDTPIGFEPIARKRTKKKVELTYKYRSAVPLPASPSLTDWQCLCSAKMSSGGVRKPLTMRSAPFSSCAIRCLT